MGMFDLFPYTNFHELNLDWILQALKEIEQTMDQFVTMNAIKYADPIQWNITRQYEKNTIVIDPLTGTAYLSVKPVPTGVSLSRTEYWTVVFDLSSFIIRAAKNFTDRYESDTTTTATFSTTEGAWLVWGDTLYKALTNITAGDTYVINGNIEHFTIEDIYNAYLDTIAQIITTIGDLDDLTTSDTSSIVGAINSVQNAITLLIQTVGALASLETTDKTSIVNAINELVGNVGDLTDLTTTDKTSIVNAINELVSTGGGSLELIGDLNDLDTTNKTNLVAAINEVLSDLLNIDFSVYQKFVSDPYFQNIGVLHTQRATNEIIGQDICKIGNTLLLCNRGTVTGLNADSHIYSIDLTTGSYSSVVLPIGHGNGITYNPDDGMLYICPLDPTTVGGKYVIHRVNYPAMTMALDVYTDEYYSSIAYNPVKHNFIGMRRNAPTQFDVLDENLFVTDTLTINVQGVGQTIDAYGDYIYILESAPNKITIANYNNDILWCYVAPEHFAHYPLGEFNGITYDSVNDEIILGDNLNYGNGFLVSSYNFFRINLHNNNVVQRELVTNYFAEEYRTISVAPNNTIFEYGTADNPVSLLEYAIAMAHCIDNPAIIFDADYDSLHPIRIVSMVSPLVMLNSSHDVHIKGFTALTCSWLVFRGITFDGKCIETASVILINDSNAVFQNCTINKAAAGVGTDMVVNRANVIAPSTPFSTYTINSGVAVVNLV